MQADVGPLIVFYVHCYLWLSGSSLFGLDVGPDHVIGLARRHPLRELAPVVRDLFPLRFLLVDAADLDGNAVGGTIVLAPHRAENQRVVFRRLLTTLVVPPETGARSASRNQQGRREHGGPYAPRAGRAIRRSHRPRSLRSPLVSPLPLRPPTP